MFDCYDTLITPEEVADMLGCRTGGRSENMGCIEEKTAHRETFSMSGHDLFWLCRLRAYPQIKICEPKYTYARQ